METQSKVIANLNHYQYDMMNKVWDIEYTSPTIRTYQGGGQGVNILITNENNGDMKNMCENEELTVRKLTSREAWRLMNLCKMNEDGSFDDTAYEKAAETVSESQLYKQAGNSIVVACLENIFESMLLTEPQHESKQTTLF